MLRMKHFAIVVAAASIVLIAGAASTSQAAIIYEFSTINAGGDQYDATKVSIIADANVTAPNATGLPSGRVGLSRFFNSEWSSGGFDLSAGNGTAIDNAAEFATGYWELTVSAGAGYELDLTSLDFGAAEGGTSGTRLYQLFAAVNGGGFTFGDTPIDSSPGGDETGTRDAPRAVSVDLTGGTYQGVDSVTFRYYPLTPAVTNTIGFDGWTLNGAVTPEPATMSLLALGGLAILRRRRRA